MFSLRQLRYFVSVAEHEHAGQAATQLNISQSPLSRQMIELEARLGVSLFHRSKKRLKLSVAGREFLAEAKLLLANADRLERRVGAIAEGRSGSLIIGYVDGAIHAQLISSALRSHDQRIRSINLKLLPMRSQQQFEKLAAGEIDIALTYAAPFKSDEIVSTKIHSEAFVLAGPAGSGLGNKIHARQLNGKKFVCLPENDFPDARIAFLQACRHAGFEPDISLEATSPLAALDLVSAGLGFAVVQESLTRLSIKDVSFHSLPTDFPQNVEIHLSHRPAPASHEQVFLNAICDGQPI